MLVPVLVPVLAPCLQRPAQGLKAPADLRRLREAPLRVSPTERGLHLHDPQSRPTALATSHNLQMGAAYAGFDPPPHYRRRSGDGRRWYLRLVAGGGRRRGRWLCDLRRMGDMEMVADR